MKTLTAMLSLVAVATGTAGAAIAYASTAPESSTGSSISTAVPTPKATVATPGLKTKVRFRDCRAGAQLEHGKCVRHVVRTVVQPAPVVTAFSSSTSNDATGRSRDEQGDGPRKARQSAGEHPAEHSKHEEGHEPEGSEDHASVDAPETDD